MRFLTRRNKGFIKTIVVIIIALVLLKYFFNITVGDIFNSRIVKDVWGIIKPLFVLLWEILLSLLDFLKSLLESVRNSLAK